MVRTRAKTPLMDYVRPAFGMGLGIYASFILYMLVAVAFFVPGFILVQKENAKKKEEQSAGVKVFGYVLMALGMVIGLGFGASTFFGELAGEF